MKKIKFITVITLCFSFFITSQRIISANDKIILNNLINYEIYNKGGIIALNDQLSFDNILEERVQVMSYLVASNDNDDCAILEIETIDYSQVDLEHVGTYPVYINLKLSDPYIDMYQITDELKTIKFFIKVSDPDNFDVFITSVNPTGFDFCWLSQPNMTNSIYYLESEQELSSQDLDNQNWQLFEDNIVYNFYRLHHKKLIKNKHYYFYFKNKNGNSNTIHIYYNYEKPNYDYIGGDRDGGDTESTPPSDNCQPAPDNPTNFDETVVSNNDVATKDKISKYEYFGNSRDALSGQRILVMQETSKNNLKFSKHGITISIPSSSIDILELKDSDTFIIEINKISDYQFSFNITINNQKITKLPNIKVMFPCSINKNKPITITSTDNKKYSGTYDETLNIVTFTTDYPDTYKINLSTEKQTNNKFNYFPIMGLILTICLVGFILIKRGKKYGKKIQ